MRRVTRTLPISLIVVALVALMAAPASANQQVERPYKGNEAGTSMIDPGCPDFFAGCDLATESTGISSHLGKTVSMSQGTINLIFVECLLLDGETGGLVFTSSGTFTTRAANGSEIWGTFENTGCAGAPGTEAIGTAINGTQTITGGTGRFMGATGSTVTSGHGFGSAFDLTWQGTLTY